MALFLAALTRSRGTQGITFGADLATGDVGSLSVLTANHLQGSILDFMSGFNSIPIYGFGYGCREMEG